MLRRLSIVSLLFACSAPPAPAPAAPAPTPASTPATPMVTAEVPFPVAAPDEVCSQSVLPGNDRGYYGDPGRLEKSVNACDVATNNLVRDEAAMSKATPTRTANSKPWDKKARLARIESIQRRFAITQPEIAKLSTNGFAVLSRAEMPSYAYAYHEIFQSQLPVYITADSIFHAIFASHDAIVASIERNRLAPTLDQALNQMHCALPTAANDYPRDVARDLDLYLIVARSLSANADVKSKLGDAENERAAADLVAKITAANALSKVTMFGRERAIDFTAYLPRGHYAENDDIKRYFRVAMWASRLEFNLVSRSSRSSLTTEPDPKETPREALAGFALADLAKRSGADAVVATVENAWGVLAGKREDVTLAQLGALRTKANVASLRDAGAFDALKAAIGSGFVRTTRVHPMPEGSKDLPVIATLIGPRIVVDAHAIMPLVNGAVPKRTTLGVADVAYAMGHDHAKTYLANEIAKFPNLEGQLEVARKIVTNASATAGDDLYAAWFAAIRALAQPVAGKQPSFLTTSAGKDLRLNTITAAYGQLKHNYVLMAGQPYSEFGCEIPDGFVEPVPAAYRALEVYAKRGEAMAALVDPKDTLHVKAHFERIGQVMRLLASIADDELADRPLTALQKRWLGMVAELSLSKEDVTGHPPYYTGWYFDLFYHRQEDGMRGADFIADYFTGDGRIAYVGARAPRIGVFAIDTSGGPRAFVGPVAHAYEVGGPLATRYSDKTAPSVVDEPWAASYSIPAAAAPASLSIRYDSEKKGVVIASDQDLGAATISLLDHHRVAWQTKRITIKKGTPIIITASNKKLGALGIEVGGFRGWALAGAYGDIYRRWGKVTDGTYQGEPETDGN